MNCADLRLRPDCAARRRPVAAWGAALAALALAVVAAMPAAALADDASSAAALSPVSRGFCDFFTVLEGRVDSRGQEVIAEKDLEYARRSDEVSEKLRLEAMNSQGDAYRATLEDAEALVNGEATVDELTGGDEGEAPTDQGADAGSDTSDEESAAKPAKTAGDKDKKRVNTIRFHGEYIPYEQGSPADEEAPARVAAAWVNDGDVTDGENTYFIGHNPGVFSGVMDLELGDKVTVWDGQGRVRHYYVFDVLTLPNKSNYFRYEGRIAPSGESITLQTCCPDNLHVRCVMAW